MRQATLFRNLAVAALAVGAIGAYGLLAEAQEIKTTTLVKTPLAGVEGKEARVTLREFPPGWVSAKHYHPGDLFVYVLEGSGVVEVEGKAPQAVGPGDVFHEEPNQVMVGRNASASEWLKAIIFQVGETGTPLTVKVE